MLNSNISSIQKSKKDIKESHYNINIMNKQSKILTLDDILDDPVNDLSNNTVNDLSDNTLNDPFNDPLDNTSKTNINIDNNQYTIDTFVIPLKEYNFITESSKNIDKSLITYAESIIERGKYTIALNNILEDIQLAIEMELGIFESTLVFVTNNQLLHKLTISVYEHKFNDMILNIDTSSYLRNYTLKPSVLSKQIKAQHVPFLAPSSLHPIKWISVINKKEYQIDKEKNMATTDLYKCYKCHENKCEIYQAQIRSADEPITTFIRCLVCNNTFTK